MSGSDQIWAEALRTLERGQSFALATVVNVRGSTPREVGAKMIVREDGQFGTIGGGCGEAEVFRKARVLLEEKNDRGARLAEVDLTGDFDQREIGTCGGIMDVFVDLWSPSRDLGIARKLADFAGRSAPGALLTVIDSGARAELVAGSRTFIDPRDSSARDSGPIDLPAAGFAQIVDRTTDAIPTLLELDGAGGMQPVTRLEPNGGMRLFVDPIVGAQRLIIVGAGHIAVPLCALGAMLGFHVTVIDDRASFANRERFPQADEIIVKPFTDAIDFARARRPLLPGIRHARSFLRRRSRARRADATVRIRRDDRFAPPREGHPRKNRRERCSQRSPRRRSCAARGRDWR